MASLLLVALAALPQDVKSESVEPPLETAARELVEQFVEDKPYLAVSVGITVDGKKIDFGVGKVEGQAPNASTLYEIGSVTKVFTGTLLADSALRKKVRIDDPVQKYLPDDLRVPARDGCQIGLGHLATHTSSLPVQPPTLPLLATLNGTRSNPYSKFDLKKLSKSLGSLKLGRPIGSKHAYSNLGVGLLGHALAEANGCETFEEALRQRILEPLEMQDTSIRLTDERRARMAPGHTASGEVTSTWDFACLSACGGIRSNVADMLVFAEASMANDGPLKGAFSQAKQTWRYVDSSGRTCAGLCWMRMRTPRIKGDVWWHNGGTGGYRSFFGTIPGKKIAVVVLSNSAGSVDKLALDVLQVLSPGAAASSGK